MFIIDVLKHKTISCSEPALRSEILDRKIDEFLLEFAPSSDMLEWLNKKTRRRY